MHTRKYRDSRQNQPTQQVTKMAPGNQIKRTFGQAYRSKGRGNGGRSGASSRYQRQHGSSSSSRQQHSKRENELTEEQEKAQRRHLQKLKRRKEDETFDAQNGFERFCFASSFSDANDKEKRTVKEEIENKGKGDGSGGDGGGTSSNTKKERRGWVFNMLPTVSRWSYVA